MITTDRGSLPLHVGIVLDGNRRLARRLLKKPWEGHALGVGKAREVLRWACDLGIRYITAYVLSYENLKSRPKAELRYILGHLSAEMDSILGGKHVVHETETKVRFIGRTSALSKSIRDKIAHVERMTEKYRRHFLNVAIAYGGQQEITDAVRSIAKRVAGGTLKPSQISENLIRHSLYTDGTPYPDLIVRTGGERRLSNFLLWQSAYSELVFVDKMWPELAREDFAAAIAEFQQRQRRFGK